MKRLFLIILTLTILSSILFNLTKAENQPVIEMDEGGLMIEAEDLLLKNAHIIIDDENASGGKATMWSDSSISISSPYGDDEPTFSLNINVKIEGTYMVYFRLRTDKGNRSTCMMNIDNTKKQFYEYSSSPEYSWLSMVGYKLQQGMHTINYYYRTRMIIDKIIITNNASEFPEGFGEIPNKFSLDNQKIKYDNLLYPLPPVVPNKEHPRLFVTKDKLKEIKNNLTHPQNIAVYNKILKVASNNYDCVLNPENVTDNSNMLYLEYIDANAFLYLINKDKEAGNKAVNGMHTYLKTLNVEPGSPANRNGMCAVFNAAIVYDWCYDIIPKHVKEEIINLSLLTASRAEFGWPPTQLNAYNSDHGDEFVLMKNLFAFSIAIYDDYETPYNMVAGRLFSEFIPSRNLKFENNIYNTQGDDYGRQVRSVADWFFRLLLDSLGCGDLISENQHYNAYQQIFRRLPNGYFMSDSDIYNHPTGEYIITPTPLFLGATLFNDPYLKGELFLADRGIGITSMNDRTISSALYLILNNVEIGTLPKEQLPLSIYTGDTSGIMVARTSWDDGFDSNAFVVSMKTPEKYFAGHSHRDSGHFYIYYKGPLALDSGVYESKPFVDQAGNTVNTNLNAGSVHNLNYAKQTIAHNCMLIYDPDEKFAFKDAILANSGGQNSPYSTPGTLDSLKNDITVGEVIAKDMGEDLNKPDYTYLSGDLTKAYGKKAKEYTRSFMFLNFFDEVYPGALIVFDRVTSENPAFKKTWLLHSQKEPEFEGTKTTVRYDDFEYNGRLINETLLPKSDNLMIEKIGGEGKEFLIGDWNYMAIPHTSVRSEKGKWRVEISPKEPSQKDYFLNVIQVSDSKLNPEPLKSKFMESDKFYGVKIRDRAAFFSKEKIKHSKNFDIEIEGKADEKIKIAVADLATGVWDIEKDGKIINSKYVSGEGSVLYFEGTGGKYSIKKSRAYAEPYEKDLSILARVNTSILQVIKFNYNGLIYSSIKPIEHNNEIYLPIDKLIPLFDDLAQINVENDKLIATLYDEPVKRTVTISKNSDMATVLLNGKSENIKLNYPVISFNDSFYIHYSDLSSTYNANGIYSTLGKIVSVTNSFKRVDNSANIVNVKDDNRAKVIDIVASGFNPSGPPYQAFDNNLATLFTVEGKDTWLRVELEEPTNIKGAAIVWNLHDRRTQRFAIDISADGNNYIEVFNGESEIISNDDNSFEYFEFESSKIRFIRLRMYGNSINNMNSMKEIYFMK